MLLPMYLLTYLLTRVQASENISVQDVIVFEIIPL